MGWASGSCGSYLAEALWQAIRDCVQPEKRKDCAERIYQLFSAEDADDWDPESDLQKDRRSE